MVKNDLDLLELQASIIVHRHTEVFAYFEVLHDGR